MTAPLRIHPLATPTTSEVHTLRDGAAVHLDDRSVEVRNASGRLLLRYVDGHAEVTAPDGDLRLLAPNGKVVCEAAQGIELSSDTELRHSAPRITLNTESLDVQATSSRLTSTHATVLAERIATSAASLTQRVERYELTATRIVERTRDTLREASGLMQTRAGRVRTLVKGGLHLLAGRTTIVSKKETSIDGSKVLLG